MKLEIIIVSYNVRELLRNCLRSVFASAQLSAEWLDVHVTVVDNASADGSAVMVAEVFPQVNLIASGENLGFTGGNNLAMKRVGDWESKRLADASVLRRKYHGENLADLPLVESVDKFPPGFTSQSPNRPIAQSPNLLLLLNPDTEIVGDALGQMAAFLRDHPEAGAVGAHLRYGDGRFQHGGFRFPGLAQVALDLLPLAQMPGLRRLLPRLLASRINGRYDARQWASEEPFSVDFVLGAAMMVSSEMVEDVGLLDDGYFMYCEEMDWALRMQRAGWQIFALPSAHVIHHEGQSSRQTPWQSQERLWRSRFRFYQKHADQFFPGFTLWLRVLVRGGLRLRTLLAWARFAGGEIDGNELGRELAAYRAIRWRAENTL